MRITIPKEYSRGWNGKIFVARWLNQSLLITSRRIKEQLFDQLDVEAGKDDKSSALVKVLKAGFTEVEINKNGSVSPPEWLGDWLGGGKIFYKKDRFGLLVYAK